MTTGHDIRFFNRLRDLDRFSDEVSSFFGWNQNFDIAADDSLPLNVWVNDESARIDAPMPGVQADSIEISVLADVVTLSGRRQSPEGQKALRRERLQGEFLRRVQLPFRVDANSVEARYTHGMLSLQLPRAPEDKRRRINVQAA